MNENEDRKDSGASVLWQHKLQLAMIALPLLIAAILIFAVIRLIVWNYSDTEPVAEPTEDFSVETIDQMFYVSEADLANHPDDGEEVILCLGNDPFADDIGEGGLAALIARETGATVYNGAFPNSRVAALSLQYDPAHPEDVTNFFYLSSFLAQGDFSALDSFTIGISHIPYRAAYETLSQLDMNRVDTLLIFYDAADYLQAVPFADSGNEFNPVSYAGAWRSGLTALRTAYPHIRIVVMSMTYCIVKDPETGRASDSDLVNFGSGRLPTYWTTLFGVADEMGISFIDNYYGTADATNAATFLRDDTHLTDEARAHIARHVAEALNPDRGSSTP